MSWSRRQWAAAASWTLVLLVLVFAKWQVPCIRDYSHGQRAARAAPAGQQQAQLNHSMNRRLCVLTRHTNTIMVTQSAEIRAAPLHAMDCSLGAGAVGHVTTSCENAGLMRVVLTVPSAVPSARRQTSRC